MIRPGRNTALSRVSVSLVLLLQGCSMTVLPSSQISEGEGQRDLPRVTVPLLGSTRDIRGMDLPEGLHAERVGGAELLKPHSLTLRLPGGRPLTINARSMSVISLNGIVKSVYIRRPMEPMRFKEAVADLRRTMKSLGIEPDRQMTEQMNAWGENNPGREEGAVPNPDLYKTGVEFAPGICDLDIRVSPDTERGWYYLMMFATSAEACRAALKAANEQATPIEQSSGKVSPATVKPPEHKVTVPLLRSTRDIQVEKE